MVKESVISLRNQAIFRETFNSPDAVVKNGGVATAVSFANGVGTFNGTSSGINYDSKITELSGLSFGSIRLKIDKPVAATGTEVLFSLSDKNDASSDVSVALNSVNLILFGRENGSTIFSPAYAYGSLRDLEIVCVGSASGNVIYVNGVSVATGTAGFFTVVTNINSFNIGKRIDSGGSENFFNGSMDLVEIYPRVLSAEEVKMLYDETLHTSVSNNAGYNTAGVLTNASLTPILEYDFVKNKSAYNKVEYGDNKTVNYDFGSWTKQAGGTNTSDNNQVITTGVGGVTMSMFDAGKTYLVRFAGTTTTSIYINEYAIYNKFYTGTFDDYQIITRVADSRLYLRNIEAGTTTFTKLEVYEINNSNQTLTDCTFGQQGLIANGTTTKLDTGSTADLTGNITIECIINPVSYGESNSGRILDNHNFSLTNNSDSNQLRFTRNGYGKIAYSDNNSILINDNSKHCVVTSSSNGTTNIYIDGKQSGTANQSGGTPDVGTTNIFIGNRSGGDRTFDGVLKVVNAYSGIMTLSQIQKKYNMYKSRGYLQ